MEFSEPTSAAELKRRMAGVHRRLKLKPEMRARLRDKVQLASRPQAARLDLVTTMTPSMSYALDEQGRALNGEMIFKQRARPVHVLVDPDAVPTTKRSGPFGRKKE